MLIPCTTCRRHIRDGEARCPFCGSSFTVRARAPEPIGRLTRAAMFAFGTTLAAGCGEPDPAPPPPPITPSSVTPTPAPLEPVAVDPAPAPEAEPAPAPEEPELAPEAEPVPVEPAPDPEPADDPPRRRPRRPVPATDPGTVVPAYGAPASAYGGPPLRGPGDLE